MNENEYEFGMTLEVDLEKVEQFVMSDKFRDFLLDNTTEFATAAFIFQTLLDKLNEVKGE